VGFFSSEVETESKEKGKEEEGEELHVRRESKGGVGLGCSTCV